MSSSYTLKNLIDVDDAAKSFGIGSDYTARFPREDLGCVGTGFSLQTVAPNAKAPFAHSHTEAEEVYVIIAGSGQMLLDDLAIPVERLDAIRVDPGVVRTFASGSDGLEILVFGPRVEGDGTMTEASWPA